MAAVPEADVVITNPTHFAVALKYDPAGGAAAAGQRQRFPGPEDPRGGPGAQGDGHGVADAGAKAVYYSTELDQEIPAGLYLAVAQVLAYVYQLKQYQAGKGKRPSPLKDLPIPPDLRRDE